MCAVLIEFHSIDFSETLAEERFLSMKAIVWRKNIFSDIMCRDRKNFCEKCLERQQQQKMFSPLRCVWLKKKKANNSYHKNNNNRCFWKVSWWPCEWHDGPTLNTNNLIGNGLEKCHPLFSGLRSASQQGDKDLIRYLKINSFLVKICQPQPLFGHFVHSVRIKTQPLEFESFLVTTKPTLL